ncbi:hypothetical protein BY996DRAFT_6591428 [Phakopsora pachyrhizi]|nr:hypothetical protein BY996DRAFT_6591428 [Phakopsora pachyrhizi]
MTSGQDRYRQDWALDETYCNTRAGKEIFSRETGRTRHENSSDIYPGSRKIGRPPPAIPRYTGNYNQNHSKSSLGNQSAKYNSVNNNQSSTAYQVVLDEANPEDTRLQTPGNRGSWRNQRNQAYDNFYQDFTRPKNDNWSETSPGFGTYGGPSSVDQGHSTKNTYHNRRCHFAGYNIGDLETLYLIRDGQIIDEDEALNLLLQSFLTQLRRLVSFKLIKQGNIPRYNNRTYPIPPINKIKILIENEIKFMKVLDSANTPKSPMVGKSKEEKSFMADAIGPKAYRTTTLTYNTYIEGKQGIQNQIVNKNKEKETSTNLASTLDKFTKRNKEDIQTASTDYYQNCKIPENYDQEN